MTRSEIVGTMGISQAIEELINESYKFLIFVSPYIKITDRLKAKLIDMFTQVDSCYFIYRKNELKKEEENWFESFNNVHLIGVNNLHAKIYFNEKKCVLTSMNFYEYSQINNYEIGIVLDMSSDDESFQKILNEVLLITRLTEKHNDITKTLEPYLDYSVGLLFKKLQDVNKRYTKQNYNDEPYVRFCNDARKLMEFNEGELYRDKTAILRSSNIGKDRFELVFKKLK
jgi:phosphatidylserine/phosphatidylglycerophosphate/cardiolipin synthase-like enzyme